MSFKLSLTDPVRREKDLNVLVKIELAVIACAELLRLLAFRGNPTGYAAASIAIAAAFVAFGITQFFNSAATMHRLVYVACLLAGAGLGAYWTSQLP